MSREKVIESILENKLIAILRGLECEDALKTVQALYEGGFRLAEITFDMSDENSWQNTADTVAALCAHFEGLMHIGVGTVINEQQVALAKAAGAEFVISPDTCAEVITRTRAEDMVSIPGAFTPSEILTAHKLGADFVKVFPTVNVGPDYFKNVLSPLSGISLLAVGGVNKDNIRSYLAAGAKGAGLGGKLVDKKLIAAGNFAEITALAKEYVELVRED